MDQEILINESDTILTQIISRIENNKNFLLSGGAGSGKTYSLVQVLQYIVKEYPKKQIACITFTNAAADEILSRVKVNNLYVSTIHEFLWLQIQRFQNEMKQSIIELIQNSKIKVQNFDENLLLGKTIQYKEYTQIANGIISHDEVILIANHMFNKYPKLKQIVIDRYPYILVDEYQDTDQLVIEILLNSLQSENKKSVIGLFGDEMQAIYDKGIGNLDKYIDSSVVDKIEKRENRRNPQVIIDIGNKIRTDGLVQIPSTDQDAPNMLEGIVKKGNALFLYSKENINIKESKFFVGWDFQDPWQTKELRLTHNLIAQEAGFEGLMSIYDKDPIVKFVQGLQAHIKKQNKEINEQDSFEKVIYSADWRYLKKGKHNGETYLEDRLKDEVFLKCYNQVKNLPYCKVKKIKFNKDDLLDDINRKRGSMNDQLIKHLFKIQELVSLYDEKRYNEFLRKTEFRIVSVKDKQRLKENIEQLRGYNGLSISEVIDKADDMGLCRKDDHFYHFIKEKEYLYERVKDVPYSEFVNLYNYLEGYLPFSTQHKIKVKCTLCQGQNN
ncbi:UvrD-helicase domain-containing protein [Dubosiella newyorkensis]|uniref:UvrD-helicase domain-containing protein n=1 Tax=Dubosiella newyorkensis TaxID=1862672 RepID=UPI0025722220|nr:UvrD-helicase domain-containing protein [Dubosiella newyorkensis]